MGFDNSDLAAVDPGGVRHIAKAAMHLPPGFLADNDEPLQRQAELIRDCVPRHGTGALIGQSGAGKTFVAVHMQTCLASGQAFFGRAIVEKVGCVHLAYENAGNFQRRMRAARLHAGLGACQPFVYAKRAGNLLEKKHREETIAALKACAAWFKDEFKVAHGFTMIDTASTSFVMKDENSNSDIAAVCSVLAEIADKTGAFTTVIHHMGKDPKAGARGGSAWRGNVDISLMCLADRENDKWSNRRIVIDKSRDGDEGALGGFDLMPTEIGREEDGKPFYSMAVTHTGAAKATKGSATACASIITFRRAFDEARHTHGRKHAVLAGDGVPSSTVIAVPVEAIRTEFYRRYEAGNPEPEKAQEARRQAFKRALKATAADYGFENCGGEELRWSL